MKIGMTSLTFRKHSVEETARFAVKAGLCGIEWGVAENHVLLCDKERAKEIVSVSEANGLCIFSLGSYCNMRDEIECDKALETACLISAPVIRLWAGEHGTNECTAEEYKEIILNTRRMADKAAACGVKLGFEYHQNSLTDTSKGAVKLISDIARENVGLYWQPDSDIPASENRMNFKAVRPYLCGNLHVQNYTREGGYRLLSEIYSDLSSYYSDVAHEDYNLLIEFCRGSLLESLIADAEVLRNIIGE